MQHLEIAGIAVMAGGEALPAVAVIALDNDLFRPADHRCADHPFHDGRQREFAGRRVVQGRGGMRCRGAGKGAKLFRPVAVDACIDNIAVPAGRELKGQAPGMGFAGGGHRRRPAGIGNDGCAAHCEPLIAGMRS